MRCVFLQGLGRESGHWAELFECLLRQYPNATIISPDYPGCGELFKLSSPLSIDDYIPYLQQQWLAQTASQPTQPTLLVGLSFGGMVAMTWAKHYPKQFSKLWLINTSSPLQNYWQRLNLGWLAKNARAILGLSLAARENAILKLTCRNHNHWQKRLEHRIAIQKLRPVSRLNWLRQLFAAAHFKLPAANQLPPVRLIVSSSDPLVSPLCSEALAAHFFSPLQQHTWAGHDLPQDVPDWFLSLLRENLKP